VGCDSIRRIPWHPASQPIMPLESARCGAASALGHSRRPMGARARLEASLHQGRRENRHDDRPFNNGKKRASGRPVSAGSDLKPIDGADHVHVRRPIARIDPSAVPVRDALFALTMTPHGRHTALATRTLGVAPSRCQDERSRAGTLRRDRRTLERCTDARLVPGDRHRVEGRYRWLVVYCGGCRHLKPIDLASVDVHPQAGLTSLILMLRCRQCGGQGPLPRLVGLSRCPAAAAAAAYRG
jgi:hypothetical protein